MSEESNVLDSPITVNREDTVRRWHDHLVDRSMLLFVCTLTLCFGVSLWFYLQHRLSAVQPSPLVLGLIGFKALIEVWCSLYAGYFVFLFVYYLGTIKREARTTPVAITQGQSPELAIVYLCCRDLDLQALESLCRTRAKGPMRIFIHDDSQDVVEYECVDRAAEELRASYGVEIEVLRRPERTGGKPGAMNYVLQRIPEEFEWMLVCDNDSKSSDPDWYLRVTPLLSEATLGCVQFKNMGDFSQPLNRLDRVLYKSIEVFEVFVKPAQRFGWLPFFGHNGLLRIDAVREVGGFTPGEFADDIDVSIRLNLAGYRIRYFEHVEFTEDHPGNYRAFRTRSYKWAFGCTSVLRRWGLKILASPKLTLQQKFFFFIFIGFYFTQIALLAYLFIAYLLMPLLVPEYAFSPLYSFLGGTLVILLMYLPTLAYFLGNDRLREWPVFALGVGLVYGSIDFASARAIIDCLTRRKRTWVPTNTIGSDLSISWRAWGESLVGLSLLAVPYVMLPHLLYLPCSYLFALKFIGVPVLHCVYREDMV